MTRSTREFWLVVAIGVAFVSIKLLEVM